MTVHAMDLSIQLSMTKDHSARNTRVTGMYTKELGLIDHAIL